MSTPEKPPDHRSEEDAFLDKLIRASRRESEAEFVRPDEDAILAYLTRTASKDQEESVNRALLQSEAFRREIFCMAEDIDALDSEEHLAEKKRIHIGAVPSLSEFLRTGGRVPRPPAPNPFLAWLQGLSAPRRLVPVAVAAAALVTVIARWGTIAPWMTQVMTAFHHPPTVTRPPSVPPPTLALAHWSPVDTQIDPGLLESNVVKGPIQEEGPIGERVGVFAGFREQVVQTDTGWRKKPIERPAPPAGPHRTVLLLAENESGNRVASIAGYIPWETDSSRFQVTAWALTLRQGRPDTLFSLPMPSDTVEVVWSREALARACVVFTFPKGGGYQAAPGFVLEQ